jgi:hypothetical protein
MPAWSPLLFVEGVLDFGFGRIRRNAEGDDLVAHLKASLSEGTKPGTDGTFPVLPADGLGKVRGRNIAAGCLSTLLNSSSPYYLNRLVHITIYIQYCMHKMFPWEH